MVAVKLAPMGRTPFGRLLESGKFFAASYSRMRTTIWGKFFRTFFRYSAQANPAFLLCGELKIQQNWILSYSISKMLESFGD